jgi:hypothetical protein
MPGGNGFYPPAQFSPIWFVIGVALLVIVVVYFVLVLVLTRRSRVQEDYVGLEGLPMSPYAVRDTYLALIDDVVRAHGEGGLGAREAHQRLAVVVREFAAHSRGVRAPYMTLGDLRASRVGPLADTVEALYPGEFGPDDARGVVTAAERARRLVSEWR